MNFVFLLQAAQDGDGRLDCRLAHQYFLKTTLQGRVFLDVFAVFIQSGCTHTVQFTPCQSRFEHVASVHRAFGFASADHGVQLINEHDGLAFIFGQIFQHRFQAFFKLTSELGTGQQRRHVQTQHPLTFE